MALIVEPHVLAVRVLLRDVVVQIVFCRTLDFAKTVSGMALN